MKQLKKFEYEITTLSRLILSPRTSQAFYKEALIYDLNSA